MAFAPKIKHARFQSFGYTGEQMAAAGTGMIARAIIPRIKNGTDANDQAAPPLSSRYAALKATRGLEPLRNWLYTGRTLRSMKVVSAGPNKAVIGFTDAETNKRAYINNARSRQFGASPSDKRILEQEFAKLPNPVRAVQV